MTFDRCIAPHGLTMIFYQARKAEPTLCRTLPAHETVRIYHPDRIALEVRKVFPTGFETWKHAASDQGVLRIRPACKLAIVGLHGSLAARYPPSFEEPEAWEASKPKDRWDYWWLFDFISVPAEGKKGGIDIVIFHSQHSFQERPLEVAFRLQLPKTEAEFFITEQSEDIRRAPEQKILQREWERLRTALEKRFGSADLKKQRLTVGQKVYDVTFPDQ